jgi:hypothetical protein
MVDVNAENVHHEVHIAVTSTHVAHKARRTVASLAEMQRRVGVAMCVIFGTPAFCSAVTDAKSQRFRYLEDGNVFPNPCNIRLKRFTLSRDNRKNRIHGRTAESNSGNPDRGAAEEATCFEVRVGSPCRTKRKTESDSRTVRMRKPNLRSSKSRPP